MRRPRPRSDAAHNTWVTRAGGRLKTLAKRPKTADTESAAWTAFYAYTNQLGNPVPTTLQAVLDGHGLYSPDPDDLVAEVRHKAEPE